MPPAEVYRLLGPASMELPLTETDIAWGYGRQLWFVFSQGRLSAISTELAPLSAFGRNLIDYREGFDDSPWQVNGNIDYRTPIEQVITSLGLSHTKAENEVLYLGDAKRQLALNFDTFHNLGTEPLLTGFSLYQNKTKLGLSASQLIQPDISAILKRLSPLFEGQRPTLEQLQQDYPQMAKLAISTSGEWWLLGNHLQLQFKDNNIHKVRVASGIFMQEADTAIVKLVDEMDIAVQKGKLLAQFKQANDDFDSVDVTEAQFTLIAKYDDYDDDAPLYELELTYF